MDVSPSTHEPEDPEDYEDTFGESEEEAFEEDDEGEDQEQTSRERVLPGEDRSRGSSREFEEPDLPWAEEGYSAQVDPLAQEGLRDEVEPAHEEAHDLPEAHERHSTASSREFGEPHLPWAEDDYQDDFAQTQEQSDLARTEESGFKIDQQTQEEYPDDFARTEESGFKSGHQTQEYPDDFARTEESGFQSAHQTAEEEYQDDFARTEESGFRDQTQAQPPVLSRGPSPVAPEETAEVKKMPEEVFGQEDLAEALRCFKAGDFQNAIPLARKAKECCHEQTRSSLQEHGELPEDPTDAGDAWRAAMDRLAAAHETAGDVERAEALYLRMLAWREGADQFEAGNFEVGHMLFKKSCSYRSVEDATWFLHHVKPDDGHVGLEAVALLALGEEVAAKAAIAVWTLALRASQREQLTVAGALELTAKAIAFHGNNAELQAAGCGLLRLLCGGHRLAARNRRRLVFLGGVESVLSAMQNFPEDWEVAREACGALRAMAHKNPAGARRIIESDGFKHCMEALEHPDDAVSSLASKAIGELQCAAEVDFASTDAHAENLQALWEARLREQREAGLKSCSEKLRGPLTQGVLQAILATICVFMEDPVRYKFLNIVQPVVVCMQMFPGHEKIQMPSCQILLSLTSNDSLSNEHEEAITKFAKSGGIGPLVQAMKDLPCHVLVQRLAMGVLRNFLTGGDMNKTSAARAGAIPTIITAMQRFKNNVSIQEEAIICLTSLCDTLGRASVAARLGLVDLILTAVKSQGYGEMPGRLTERSCMILCMFADDQKLRHDIVKAGALAMAKQVISRAKNLDVQRWGCELLRSLSQAN
ncbi:unnamed protein product [Durusdinium trenchii]|uniref:Protein unc-45 homolog B n=2 Tax=Durusdinium trenchii TaxID=1381693 RepID=A0ABP0Q6H6_9DINO